MLLLALRNLFRHKLRLLFSAGGVALALLLVLALDAIVEGVEKQLTAYIDNSQADIFVAQAGVRNLHMVSSTLPRQVVGELQAIPGVAEVSPILYMTNMLDSGKERSQVYVIGLPAEATMGKPERIVEGAYLAKAQQVIIDRAVASRLNLRPGDKVKILGKEFTIAGLTENTTNIFNSIVFISMEDFARLRGTPEVISFGLVRVRPPASPQEVANQIEAKVAGVTALPREEFANQERKVVKDMAVDIINIMNLIGFLIGLAVVALTIYLATLAHRSEYGVLKALGAGNRQLYRLVLDQALSSVGLGLALAVFFTLLLGLIVPQLGLNLALKLTGASVLKVTIMALVIAGMAALLPIWQIGRLDPAQVFKQRGGGAS
ncbi:MAG TPA: ABC transporter permease [Chloroflexia bacterium]|nr:ABC transporter permease [Chloroflexia bacterium]